MGAIWVILGWSLLFEGVVGKNKNATAPGGWGVARGVAMTLRRVYLERYFPSYRLTARCCAQTQQVKIVLLAFGLPGKHSSRSR